MVPLKVPRRWPAYGRKFVEMRRSGKHGLHGWACVAVDDWCLRRGRANTVVLARDVDPDAVHWTHVVVALDIHVLHRVGNENRADAVIQAVLEAGARSAARRSFDADDNPVDFVVARSALPADWQGSGSAE